MRIISWEEIERACTNVQLMQAIKIGFIEAAEARATCAPAMHLQLNRPSGDVHIKSAHLHDEQLFVVKVASSHRPQLGPASSHGLMMLFSKETGEPKALLLDEGKLTDLRTALTGALCAQALAPKKIVTIGVIGTGTQARMQLRHLAEVTACRTVYVWGRNPDKMRAFAEDPLLSAFQIHMAASVAQLAERCQLIITATSSSHPLLFGEHLQPGTHITAVGADQPGKQELDASVLTRANLIVADDLVQCRLYGELSNAPMGMQNAPVVPLGSVLTSSFTREPSWITVADLTGTGIEDAQVAVAVLRSLDISHSIAL